MASGAARHYKEITKEDSVFLNININGLVTTEAFGNYPREVLSRII